MKKIKEIKNKLEYLLENEELDNDINIVSDDKIKCHYLISKDFLLYFEDDTGHLSFNVNSYPYNVGVISLVCFDVLSENDIGLYISDDFAFNRENGDILFGKSARKSQMDKIRKFIREEVRNERILNYYNGIEC